MPFEGENWQWETPFPTIPVLSTQIHGNGSKAWSYPEISAPNTCSQNLLTYKWLKADMSLPRDLSPPPIPVCSTQRRKWLKADILFTQCGGQPVAAVLVCLERARRHGNQAGWIFHLFKKHAGSVAMPGVDGSSCLVFAHPGALLRRSVVVAVPHIEAGPGQFRSFLDV